jgi:thioesterase domain-containing protein/acyl carrier protein
VPIGVPIPNSQVYILDERMNLVPIGAPGELFIGGAGVTRGYWRQPDWTAEKYLPDPFSAMPGARLYRTGDLTRFREDGEIEFLGRVDAQVKIRGFRIETEEIEAVLQEHAAVAQAVVLVVSGTNADAADNARLVAFVTAANGAISGGELRDYLRERLPDYMVPASITVLEALPVLPNGKVDRGALQVRGQATGSAARQLTPPRTLREAELARLWAEVLGLERVGIHENFFELGGHSLLAIKLLAKLEKRCGRALPLALLFRAGTVAELGAALDGEPQAAASPLVTIQAEGAGPAVCFVHDISGQALSYFPLAARLAAERRIYALQSPPRDHAESLTLAELAAAYLRELRAVEPRGPYVLAGHSFGAVLAFELAAQLEAAGETVGALLVLDADAPRYSIGSGSDRVLPDDAQLPEDELDLLLYAVRTLAIFFEREIPLRREELLPLKPRERFALTLARLQEQQLLPAATSASQLAALFAAYQTNIAALRNYRPGRLAARIHLWSASEAPRAADAPPARGWDGLTSDSVTVHETGGDHVSMLKEPHAATLAAQLHAVINEKQGVQPSGCLETRQPEAQIHG